ncbi:RNA cap guanine-N2 methyltransferase-domain-containing protein [Mucidula mucida]|nr:RNA cap guanine-N2 methyltransferase-domain-containing protein [Mucidula mucida]
MGKNRKRATPFSGLSAFVQQAFGGGDPSAESPAESSTAGSEEPPAKRARLDEGIVSTQREETEQNQLRWITNYDATGLVPHYKHSADVPEHLKKYFFQRTRFFSLYATLPGCLLDEEGWYSVTPELIADQIAERCRCDTILDAFCGVGGNAIAFAKTCQRVIALDTSPLRLALARHNAQIYGVADRIEFILTDYISFASSLPQSNTRKIDVVFLSPPWGGPSYLSGTPSPIKEAGPGTDPPPFSLSAIQPIHGADLFHLTRKITPNVAYYLPRNSDLDEIGALVRSGAQEDIEVEEEWMGNKLKALTCYFGGLVDGQGEMF